MMSRSARVIFSVLFSSPLLLSFSLPQSVHAQSRGTLVAPPPIVNPLPGVPPRFRVIREIKPFMPCPSACAIGEPKLLEGRGGYLPNLDDKTGTLCEVYQVLCHGCSGVQYTEDAMTCFEIETLP